MPTIRTALAALTLVAASAAGDLEPLAVELVTDDVQSPTFVTAPIGDSRLFVLEQNSGHIVLIKDGERVDLPFLDLGDLITPGGERGLLGLAFPAAPSGAGTFYVTYNDLDGSITLARYRVLDGNPDRADPNSAEVLLAIPKSEPQHNGGSLAFMPDGTLLMSTGDGGGGGDPENDAQRLDSLLGKVLRLDVSAGVGPYEVPPDNPFVDVHSALPEIFALGLRNPWRMSVDRGTGDVWLGDVGQGAREEIDRIPFGTSGQNFGWRCLEGTLCTGLTGCDCADTELTPPLHEYTHDVGCAVIGGHVYRGAVLPTVRGRYFFADYCAAQVWSLTVDETGAVDSFVDHTSELRPPGLPTLGLISSFGVGGTGELYICSYAQDSVYRVIPKPPDADCDLDGVPDDDELAAGTAFDVNGNGIPDDCEPQLSIGPLIAGLTVTFEFIGAAPAQPVVFVTSTRSIGAGPCFFGGKVCLSMLPPLQFSPAITAGADGSIFESFTVPPLFEEETAIFFQAVIVDGEDSKVTAPVTKVFTP